MGDLNTRVGSRTVEGVIGSFEIDDTNKSGEKVMDMCIERSLSIGNTYFKKKRIH